MQANEPVMTGKHPLTPHLRRKKLHNWRVKLEQVVYDLLPGTQRAINRKIMRGNAFSWKIVLCGDLLCHHKPEKRSSLWVEHGHSKLEGTQAGTLSTFWKDFDENFLQGQGFQTCSDEIDNKAT